ncbi:unnamed protein product [Caenorhabditis auriculariae]|uniref:CHCH domain-containing protein n=1 Tax=Caenorhabditis auriculariae TaxID=2777116 RepID=A0A8S1HH85_9PELO|nr:unnamed protein product [Caenorhabditis auriculariae]
MWGRTFYPKVTVFSEILPLSSKNRVHSKKAKPAGSSCTQELQALFGCLKKWEFDDKPCGRQHSSYMECIHKAEKEAADFREAAKKGTLGEGNQGNSITTAQFNKLMQFFPQPDLGKAPYRQMKRLPTQDYAEDIFHRKHWKGKRRYVCSQEVFYQAKACEEAEAKQAYASVGPHEDRKYDEVQCQETSLETHQAEALSAMAAIPFATIFSIVINKQHMDFLLVYKDGLLKHWWGTCGGAFKLSESKSLFR